MPNLSSPTSRQEAVRVLGEITFRSLLRRSTVALTVALGIPLLLLLGLIFLLMRSAALVEHTDEVIAKAHEVEKSIAIMQIGLREFWLLHEARYLQPYILSQGQIQNQIASLKKSTADNPSQSAAAGKLLASVREWNSLMKDPAAADLGETPVLLTQRLAGSNRFADHARSLLKAFIAEEEHLRGKRTASVRTIVVLIFSLLGLVALLGIPGLTLWLQSLLRRANDAYKITLLAAYRRANELHVTLSSIGDAVVATNTQGQVEFLNSVAEGMMGWTNLEAQGRPLQEVFAIFNQQTGESIENPVAQVLRENIVVGLANQTLLRSRQGIEVPIEDSAAPIRDEQGNVLGVILVFRDVTQKRKVDRQVREVHARGVFLNELGERTRVLHDGESIMKVATRLLGEHIKASRCAYAEVNPHTDEFVIPNDYTDGCASTVGHYHLNLFGPRAASDMHEDRTLILRDVDAELAREEGADMFNAIGIKALICCPLIKEGHLRAMMAVHQTTPRNWTPEEINLVEEVVERCWATIERARAEAESRERAERFRLLSEVVSLQVWMADLHGNLTYVNQECVDYFGIDTAEHLSGQGWTGFVHPDDMPRVSRLWQNSIATGQRYETEFRLQGRTGEYRWFIARAETMRDLHSDATRWFGTNTDIHDLKSAQGKAEEANRSKDAFLAALSHELRTPLTPVLMTAASLRDDERLPADVQDQLDMMERNIALEARLIDDLLDVTSIAQGKLQLRTEPSDAHALIQMAIEIVRKDAISKDIALTCDLGATRKEIDTDPARFQQVIWNLLRNAVKFTPQGGNISISTSDADENRLRIEVTDSGIGIEAHLLDTIFTPFEQGGLTGNHRFGGLGLGLAIARAILQAQQGSIYAVSAGPGLGASFIAEIPGAREPSAQQPPSPSVNKPAEGKPLRLLLVEDHHSTLAVLSKLLSRDGHQVVATTSAATALEAAATNKFDLVISDLGLPDATGHELMSELRTLHNLRGIALSGYGMEDDLERSRAAGFILHLIKPVDFTRLRHALATLA